MIPLLRSNTNTKDKPFGDLLYPPPAYPNPPASIATSEDLDLEDSINVASSLTTISPPGFFLYQQLGTPKN